jgi:hypothetical protein
MLGSDQNLGGMEGMRWRRLRVGNMAGGELRVAR